MADCDNGGRQAPAACRRMNCRSASERADEMVPLGLANFCSKPRVLLTVVHFTLAIVPKYLPWRVEYLWYAVVNM